MRIVFVVDDYSGGAGNIVQLLATEYAKKDDVHVLLTYQHAEKRYTCNNVSFHELSSKDRPNGRVKLIKYLYFWIRKQIRDIKPDVIISFLTDNSIDTSVATFGMNIPIVASERINPLVRKQSGLKAFITKFVYDRCKVITVQFEEFSKMYNGRYIDKCVITPNYIATPDREKHNESPKEVIRYVSCGRLANSKRFDLMIDAFSQIHKVLPNSELRIYGQGALKEILSKKIEALHLEESVKLMGYSTDTYNILCDSDVYLMTSENEGFPNALSEALAVGLPAVAFRCNGGIDELSDGGRRFEVIPFGDISSFATAAVEIVQPEKYLQFSNVSKEVTEVYSLKNVKKTWDKCIELAVKERSIGK